MRGHNFQHLIALFFFFFSFNSQALRIELPEVILADVEYRITVADTDDETLIINGKEVEIVEDESSKSVLYTFNKNERILSVDSSEQSVELQVNPIPLWLSIVPPLLAILLALLTREVLTSLFLGIFSGTAIIGYYNDGLLGILKGFLQIFEVYIIDALNDSGHLSIVIFSMTIGAVVALISKNGGMQGVVNAIGKYAKDAKSGQLATYFLGIAIFFDDYANTLVVGNTMRAVTDKLRISREKLAYLVDSTAAPIAALAFVTTWIGAELGYIEEGIADIPEISEGAYSIFLNSLAYSFYPILTLLFILMLILQGKDFGPMLKAEKLARQGNGNTNRPGASDDGELSLFSPYEGAPIRALNAILPIAVIILGTLLGLLVTGYDAQIWHGNDSLFRKISITIGNSDSYVALLWSSSAGLVTAILLTIGQRILSMEKTMQTVISGYKTMVTAMIILVLAWALAHITTELETAEFLKGLWQPGMSPILLPAITFILSALVSFSTGSSWGTMAILYPLLLPTSFTICADAGYELNATMPLFYNVVSAVLAGSVLGDHCSPISDTTILSSLASGCNHIEHVRTQLPYALTVGGVSISIGTLASSAGLPAYISFIAGAVLLWVIIRFFGKPSIVGQTG